MKWQMVLSNIHSQVSLRLNLNEINSKYFLKPQMAVGRLFYISDIHRFCFIGSNTTRNDIMYIYIL